MQAILVMLLGGIASGKSSVAAHFKELGAVVLNADKMVHQLYTEEQVLLKIRGLFGDDVFNEAGEIDRKAMAERVFTDDSALKTLEELLHPLVLQRIQQQLSKYRGLTPRQVVVLDVPLGAEAGWTDMADVTVFIETREETRIQRAQDNRGWSAEDLRRRERKQMPLAEKRALCSHLVHNDHSVEKARDDVRRIWSEVLQPQLEKN